MLAWVTLVLWSRAYHGLMAAIRVFLRSQVAAAGLAA
jgi:hypothetical protein